MRVGIGLLVFDVGWLKRLIFQSRKGSVYSTARSLLSVIKTGLLSTVCGAMKADINSAPSIVGDFAIHGPTVLHDMNII